MKPPPRTVKSTTTVPVELLVPILKEYLDQYDTYALVKDGEGDYQEEGENRGFTRPDNALSPITILAAEAGVHVDFLRKMAKGYSPWKTVKFDTADKLMTAMGKN